MLSVYASTVEQCTSLLDDYDPTPAGRFIQTMMIDQVSNWYVRRSRRRFWKGDMTEDKKAAYDTLFEVLLGTAKLMAPIAPFYAEWMYDRLSTYTTEAMHDSVIYRHGPMLPRCKAIMGYAKNACCSASILNGIRYSTERLESVNPIKDFGPLIQ